MTNIITISLDEGSSRVLEKISKRHRSEFIRNVLKKYDDENILPSIVEVKRQYIYNKGFEVELIDFVNKCNNILEIKE